MSQIPGFLKFVLAKERRYVYLAVAEKKNKRVKHILYMDSITRKALETMYGMRDDFEDCFPLELKDKGYDWEDLNDWILSIETGYSKYGNKLVTF